MKLKLLHTSDLHLGAKLGFLGEKAQIQRERIQESLNAIISAAIDQQVQLVLFAGDTFDTPLPSVKYIELFSNSLKKLADKQIYVAVIAGNHDHLASPGVWEMIKIEDSHIKIFLEEDSRWEVEELDTTVFGISVTSKTDSRNPLEKLDEEDEKSSNNIGLFHGAVNIGGKNKKGAKFSPDMFDSTFLDYIALGDWHGMLDVSGKKVTAWYSGSPEVVTVNQENAGNVLIVDIENGRMTVTPHRIGQTRVREEEVDISVMQRESDIMKAVDAFVDKDTILTIRLKGLKQCFFNIDAMTENLSENTFSLKIVDNSKMKLSEEFIKQHEDNLLLKSFLEVMQKQKKEDDTVYQNALQLGIHLLLDPSSIRDL